MKRIDRQIVAAVLVSKDQKILMGKIREGGVYPDCWHLPGGGIDEGENKEEALVREIKEEVGLDIADSKIKLLDDTDTGEAVKTDKNTGEKMLVKMHFNDYQVDLGVSSENIEVRLTDDLVGYLWIPMKELGKYKLTPPSQKLFKSLGWI